jgi:hypothetical protein
VPAGFFAAAFAGNFHVWREWVRTGAGPLYWLDIGLNGYRNLLKWLMRGGG